MDNLFDFGFLQPHNISYTCSSPGIPLGEHGQEGAMSHQTVRPRDKRDDHITEALASHAHREQVAESRRVRDWVGAGNETLVADSQRHSLVAGDKGEKPNGYN